MYSKDTVTKNYTQAKEVLRKMVELTVGHHVRGIVFKTCNSRCDCGDCEGMNADYTTNSISVSARVAVCKNCYNREEMEHRAFKKKNR